VVKSHYTAGLPVGSKRYLFLDDTHVDSSRDVRRNFHQLRRVSDEPLIVADRPTDQINVTIHGTVLRDTRDGALHMWYTSQRFTKEGQIYRICFAQSADGLHWDKPNVGVLEIDGETAHNVVANPHDVGESPGTNVIHRPDETNEGRRFRRIYQRLCRGTFVAYSQDGIRWDETEDYAFHGRDSSCVFYDMLGRRFVAMTIERPRIGPFLRRTPTLATSADFDTWSDFHTAFQCDDLDDRLVVERLEKRRAILSYGIGEHFHEQINNMFSFNYADMIVGLPVMFDCCGYDEWKGTPGGRGSGRDDSVTHVQLAWCRDEALKDWRRPPAREPFLPIAEPPRWDSGFVQTADSPIRVNNELWFYYSGVDRSQQHPMYTLDDGWKFKQGELQGGISAAKLRLDGFASLDADRQGGEVTTKPLTFDGEMILINAVSYHGLAADILDETGRVIPGFSADDCIPIRGDSVRHELRFKEARLAQLAGRRISLRLGMSGAMLFSVFFEPIQ